MPATLRRRRVNGQLFDAPGPIAITPTGVRVARRAGARVPQLDAWVAERGEVRRYGACADSNPEREGSGEGRTCRRRTVPRQPAARCCGRGGRRRGRRNCLLIRVRVAVVPRRSGQSAHLSVARAIVGACSGTKVGPIRRGRDFAGRVVMVRLSCSIPCVAAASRLDGRMMVRPGGDRSGNRCAGRCAGELAHGGGHGNSGQHERDRQRQRPQQRTDHQPSIAWRPQADLQYVTPG
jgi:hypothetical protein